MWVASGSCGQADSPPPRGSEPAFKLLPAKRRPRRHDANIGRPGSCTPHTAAIRPSLNRKVTSIQGTLKPNQLPCHARCSNNLRLPRSKEPMAWPLGFCFAPRRVETPEVKEEHQPLRCCLESRTRWQKRLKGPRPGTWVWLKIEHLGLRGFQLLVPFTKAPFCRDPYIIHLNIALLMVVSLCFGGTNHVFNGQHVSFKEPCFG